MKDPCRHQKSVEIHSLDLLKAVQIFFLARERLRHTDSRNVLRQGGRDAGGLFSQLAVSAHAMNVKEPGGNPQWGQDHAHRQAQAPVILQHQDDDACEGQQT